MKIYLKSIGFLMTTAILLVVGCSKSELDSKEVPNSEVSLQNNLQNDNGDYQGSARRPWLGLISVEIEFGHRISIWDPVCMCWQTSPCQGHGLCKITINGSQGGNDWGEIAVNSSELSIIIPKANFDRRDLVEQFSGSQFYHPVDLEIDEVILTELTRNGFSGDIEVIESGYYDYVDLGDEFEIVILKD